MWNLVIVVVCSDAAFAVISREPLRCLLVSGDLCGIFCAWAKPFSVFF